MNYPQRVRMVEVGPRDGLQNETAAVPVEIKVALIEALVDAGLKTVECGSFVSPKWVPQMAGTAEVFARIQRVPGISYPALVPNLKGLEDARQAGVNEIAIFAAASETFSQRNINCSISESLARLRAVTAAALADEMRVRGYVSCVLGCPFEGEIALEAVARVSRELSAMGCYEISLGDTIGVGTPVKAVRMLEAVAAHVPIAGHPRKAGHPRHVADRGRVTDTHEIRTVRTHAEPPYRKARETGARSTPEAIVLGPEGQQLYRGRIDNRFVELGKSRYQPTESDLQEALDAILQGKPAPHPVTRTIGCAIPGLD